MVAALVLAGCGGNKLAQETPRKTGGQEVQSSEHEYPNLGSEPNTTVTGRDRYARYLKERAESALQAKQYEDAARLFRQLGRIPGYEAQGQDGVSRIPVHATRVCPASDANTPVKVCQTYAGVDAVGAANPGDTAFDRPILEEPAPSQSVPAQSDKVENPVATQSVPATTEPAVASKGARDKTRTNVAGAKAVASKAEPSVTAATKPADTAVVEDPLQKRVTLEFRDASVRSLFDVITQASGLNVIFDRDVSPELKTTVFLRNTTIKAAIDKIVLTSGLAWRLIDRNTLLIYADDSLKQRDYQSLVVRAFQLRNADAKFVATSLKTVLKFKDMVVDEKLNMIVVRDTPEAIALAEKLVALHDVPEPEVMLEVAVLQVERDKLQDLGVAWPGSLSLSPLKRTVISGDATTTSDGTTTTSSTGTLTLRDLWNLTPGSMAMTLGKTTVNFSATNSNTQILANPSIRVRNREKAKILIGERVPNISSSVTSTGVTSENITYVDVGLKLDVEPQIFPGNEIGLKLGLEVSSINSTVTTTSGIVAYRIGTRTASTVLRLNDGENQILGGLIQDSDKKSVTKVPLLGDVPILGRLFRSDSTEKDKTEVLLSITPRLVRGNNRLSQDSSTFDAGTVSSVRGRRPENELNQNGVIGDNPAVPVNNNIQQVAPVNNVDAPK